MGINTWVRSLGAANYHILGMVVRHGEAFTISDKLTVWEDGKAVYRPTVHYAYCPCDAAIASLNELRGYDYQLQPRIAHHDRRDHQRRRHPGRAAHGPPLQLVVDAAATSSIEESRRLVPHQNATTMQVAISVVAACMWMIENPRRGVCVPDDLPHDYILDITKPYLGKFDLRRRRTGRR